MLDTYGAKRSASADEPARRAGLSGGFRCELRAQAVPVALSVRTRRALVEALCGAFVVALGDGVPLVGLIDYDPQEQLGAQDRLNPIKPVRLVGDQMHGAEFDLIGPPSQSVGARATEPKFRR